MVSLGLSVGFHANGADCTTQLNHVVKWVVGGRSVRTDPARVPKVTELKLPRPRCAPGRVTATQKRHPVFHVATNTAGDWKEGDKA